MLHGTPSPGVVGSELTRLLARMGDARPDASPSALRTDAPPSALRPVFADRLGHWLGWSGAIALSAALDARPVVPGPGPTGREEADFQRVRADLAAAIAAGPGEPASSPTDFSPHRRHCIALQQAMQQAVAALRQRLRAALAQRSPDGARLAAIDAVLDQALAVHERSLLGLVPLRLQAHFERLQRDAGDDPGWLRVFAADRDRVLAAELAHRLLPARGLLDTLHTAHPT